MKYFHLVPKDTNINFIGKFPIFISFSVITLIVVVAAINIKGLHYGIDFKGGTVLQVKFHQKQDPESVRKIMTELGDNEASVVGIGGGGDEYLITTRTALEKGTQSLKDRLVEKVGNDHLTVMSADVVGPKVGEELRGAALRSLFYSVILITIYIWLRFDARFAPGATIAMVHDIIMCTAFYLVTGREFTITAVAALLTIAGYSVNDTIVVYDRVREMIRHKAGGKNLAETINKAINLTLSRTVLTSFVTFISVLPLAILCKGEIQSFAIAMCFGIFVGTYSTVYIATPFTIYVEKFMESRNPKKVKVRTA